MSETHLERLPATWDDQAATFDDEADHGLRDPATRAAWRTLLLRHLPPSPARVADLGCGTGSLALLLAEAGYDVAASDFSPAMVAAARTKLAGAGVDVPVTLGDAARPDLPPGSVDVVLCRHVLWALPEPERVLERWVRLLRPGGRMLLVEGRWHTGGGLPAEQTEALLAAIGLSVQVLRLTQPDYWGAPITDERYLVVAER